VRRITAKWPHCIDTDKKRKTLHQLIQTKLKKFEIYGHVDGKRKKSEKTGEYLQS
jgi:hypothetical protein